jgi:hypothetical protein
VCSSYLVEYPEHLSQVCDLFRWLAEVEEVQEVAVDRYLLTVSKTAGTLPAVVPVVNVLDAIVRRGDAPHADWHWRAAEFVSVLASTAGPELERCWQIALAILTRFAGVEKIANAASRAFVGLVGSDVAFFVRAGLAGPLAALFRDASFQVKANIAAAVSAAFCEATVGQFTALAGLGEVLFESLPARGHNEDVFGIILHGMGVFVQKMEVLPNRSELFAEQILANDDFRAWMREMGDGEIARAFGAMEEWERFAALVRTIARAHGNEEI